MKIMVLGSGGREHALAWKIAQSPRVTKVYVAPGNAGTECEDKISNVGLSDFEELAQFAINEMVDFTVVGPEAPLAQGVTEIFESHGLKIFGPSKYAAQLESSKDFAKAFMKEFGIPTAAYETFTDEKKALEYVRSKGAPIVIKADGLAAGKGVVVAMTLEEAESTVKDFLTGNAMGDAGSKVVIEEFMEGEEASFIVMCDGKHVLPMATSQDHKRLLDGDQGPNTGGMGAYSPAPVVTEKVYNKVMKKIVEPTIEGMIRRGHPFRGFLYVGLMIDSNCEPRVVEFNCRFGDPETEPILARLQTDMVDLIESAFDKTLDSSIVGWDSNTAVGVVMASQGYPKSPKKGAVITGIDEAEKVGKVFHCGTKVDDEGNLVTNGGRVLCVVGMGHGIEEAKAKAYEAVSKISFEGAQHRTDVGDKGILFQKRECDCSDY